MTLETLSLHLVAAAAAVVVTVVFNAAAAVFGPRHVVYKAIKCLPPERERERERKREREREREEKTIGRLFISENLRVYFT